MRQLGGSHEAAKESSIIRVWVGQIIVSNITTRVSTLIYELGTISVLLLWIKGQN